MYLCELVPILTHQILQYDMWGVTPSDLWDWNKLKKDIAK